MKRTVKIIAVVLLLSLITGLSMGMLLDSSCIRWTNIRTVTTDDAATTATVWASKPSHCKSLRQLATKDSTLFNVIQVRLSFSAGNGTTCNYYIYVRQLNDDSQFVVSGAATAGTQTATAGGTYADTITTTARWIKTVTAADASGNNGMATINFDGMGAEYIEVYIDTISSGSVLVDIKGV